MASLGLVNHVTELDVSAYDDSRWCLSPLSIGCETDLPADRLTTFSADQARLYRSVFQVAMARPSVEAVVVWGLHDGVSWLNRFPRPRVDYPLLFDRTLNPKRALWALVDPTYDVDEK